LFGGWFTGTHSRRIDLSRYTLLGWRAVYLYTQDHMRGKRTQWIENIGHLASVCLRGRGACGKETRGFQQSWLRQHAFREVSCVHSAWVAGSPPSCGHIYPRWLRLPGVVGAPRSARLLIAGRQTSGRREPAIPGVYNGRHLQLRHVAGNLQAVRRWLPSRFTCAEYTASVSWPVVSIR
jgi:hypothetical protein